MEVFVDLYGEGTVSAQTEPEASMADLKLSLLRVLPLNRYSYFSFQGKPLYDSLTLSSQGIRNHSTLHLRVRVFGGGGDGGATGAESRDCYLNMYATKKPDKVDPNDTRLAKWSRCALSSEALKPPCVIDLLGNIYNKEALVSGLLTKSLPRELKYIKGLKDMVTVHLSSIPGVGTDDNTLHTKFQCPISGQEFNGKCKFYCLRGCGHVLSAKALKEVQSSSCLVCFAPFAETDKIVINGTEEEVLKLREIMEEEAAKLREKKEKKVKNGKYVLNDTTLNAIEEVLQTDVVGAVEHELIGPNGNKRKKESKTEKHLHVEKPGGQKTTQPSKRFKAVDVLPQNATKEVYASIFSSSSSKSKIKETFMCRALPLGRN